MDRRSLSKFLDDSSPSRSETRISREPSAESTNPFRNSQPSCDTTDERCNLLIVKLSQVNKVNLKLLEALELADSGRKDPKLILFLEEIKGILLCLEDGEATYGDETGFWKQKEEMTARMVELKQKHKEQVESMQMKINNLEQTIVSLKEVIGHWKEVAEAEATVAKTSQEEVLKCEKEFALCEIEKHRLEHKIQMRNDQLEETLESIKIEKDTNENLKDELTKLIQLHEEAKRSLSESPSVIEASASSSKSDEKLEINDKLMERIANFSKSFKITLPIFKGSRKPKLKLLLDEMTVFANKLIRELEEKEDVLRTQKKTEQKLEGIIKKNMRYIKALEARMNARKPLASNINQGC